MQIRFRTWINTYRFDLLAIAVIVVLWAFANWRELTPVTADQWSVNPGDFSAQSFLYSDYAAQRLFAGQIPYWLPNNYAGQPFLADPQSAVFYPPRLIAIALSGMHWTYGALQAEALIHLLIAGLLTYGMARTISGSVLGGVVASLIFSQSGILIGYPVQQIQILEAITWLPLIIWLTHEVCQRSRAELILLAGAVLGMAYHAGNVQSVLMMGYLALAYLAFMALVVVKIGWRKPLIYAALFGVMALGISAASLIPGFEFQHFTTRGSDLNFAAKASGFNMGLIVQMIWPGIVSYFSSLYIGLPSLFMIGFGTGIRHAQVRFWGAIALITAILMFGGNTILFSVIYWLLPGISLFRDWERFGLILGMALAILAAFGAKHLIAQEINIFHKRIALIMSGILIGVTGIMAFGLTLWTFGGGAGNPVAHMDTAFYALLISVLTFGGLIYIYRSRSSNAALALTALIALDLLSWSSNSTATYNAIPTVNQIPHPAYVDLLQPGAWRIDGARALTPFGSVYHLSDVFGNSPLRLAATAALTQLPVDRYWDLFAVRYVISEHDTIPAPNKLLTQSQDSSGTFYVYELTSPRSYAWLVYAADVNPDPVFARQILADSRFPLRDKTILDVPSPIDLPAQPPTNADSQPNVQMVTFEPENIVVKVSTDQNALLTLALPYYPGWQATVDNQPVALLKAYTALSAVPVQAGTHTIQVTFVSRSAQIGITISGIAVLGVLVALVVLFVRKPRISE